MSINNDGIRSTIRGESVGIYDVDSDIAYPVPATDPPMLVRFYGWYVSTLDGVDHNNLTDEQAMALLLSRVDIGQVWEGRTNR